MSTSVLRPVNGLRRVLVAGVGLLLALSAPSAFASPSDMPEPTPKVNGTVYAIAHVGDLTVIGGSFTAVGGKPRQNVAAIRADGTLDPDFNPTVNGTVRALAASEDGSAVFVGGLFTDVGGIPRTNLAAVDTLTGAALPSWQADTSGGTRGVLTLAVSADRLFVGGNFTAIEGITRPSLASVSVSAGEVLKGFRPRPNRPVNEVVVSPDGSKVYAGGPFTMMAGIERLHGVAELDATTGTLTSFEPTEGGGTVITLALSHDGSRLYFSTENNTLFAYDLPANVPTWSVKTSGDTQAIAASATEVYIGGHFSQLTTYKVKRNFLASLNPSDGTPTAWDPNPSGGTMGVWSLALTPDSLQAGGTFTSVNGVPCVRFARFAGQP